MNLVFDNLTERQQEMVASPARVLWVGSRDEDGQERSGDAACTEILLAGGAVCWVGPWSEQSFVSYMAIKRMLQPYIDAGMVKANNSTMRFFAANGGNLHDENRG